MSNNPSTVIMIAWCTQSVSVWCVCVCVSVCGGRWSGGVGGGCLLTDRPNGPLGFITMMTMLIIIRYDWRWEEFRNVYLLMTWIWLSWGDPVWLTGHQNPVTTIHHHNNNKNSFTEFLSASFMARYPGLQTVYSTTMIYSGWTKTTQSQFSQLYLPTQYRAVPDPYGHHILDCSGVRDLGWVTGGGGAGCVTEWPGVGRCEIRVSPAVTTWWIYCGQPIGEHQHVAVCSHFQSFEQDLTGSRMRDERVKLAERVA